MIVLELMLSWLTLTSILIFSRSNFLSQNSMDRVISLGERQSFALIKCKREDDDNMDSMWFLGCLTKIGLDALSTKICLKIVHNIIWSWFYRSFLFCFPASCSICNENLKCFEKLIKDEISPMWKIKFLQRSFIKYFCFCTFS